ncbi:MAG TPA: MlaD family protein [Gammaproteobacteria bacterium]
MNHNAHYINRMHYSAQERLAGVFVLGGIVILIGLFLLSSQSLKLLQGRVEFVALIQHPVGVSTDTRVHISGIDAGSVKRITLTPDNRFRVVLSIYKEYRNLVRNDSWASVSKLALVGDSVIDISPGSSNMPLLANGAVLQVKETKTLDQMLTSLQPVMDKVNVSINKIADVLNVLPGDAIRSTLENTAAVTTQLREGEGAVGALLYDARLKTELIESVRALHTTLVAAAQMTDDARSVMAQLKATSELLHMQMQAVPEMALQTRELLQETHDTVQAISHTWPISGNMPERAMPTTPQVMPSND